jgi:phosphoglycerate-specific signal transduction histidine kinase
MQLQFTIQELNLLAEMLDQRDTDLSNQISHVADGAAKETLQRKHSTSLALLDRVIAMRIQFATDELDDLADVLSELNDVLRTKIAQTPEGTLRNDLLQKKSLLQAMRDKVSEACAMA